MTDDTKTQVDEMNLPRYRIECKPVLIPTPDGEWTPWALAKITHAVASQASDAQDAARYRYWKRYFLSKDADFLVSITRMLRPHELDAVIDAGLAREGAP